MASKLLATKPIAPKPIVPSVTRVIMNFQAILRDLNTNISYIGGGIVDKHGMTFEKKAAKAMERLFEFLKDPQNKGLFTVPAMKGFCANTLAQMISHEYKLYYHLSKQMADREYEERWQIRREEFVITNLIQQAKDTLTLILTF